MNLVAHHLDAVFHAKGVHPFQFFLGPHASCGVVGVAEQEDGGPLVGTTGFEIGPVYFKGIVGGKP